ncbi:ABC transporter substrate-binding protein [Streptomyces gobiensis]|uniref:ABC transporter substrate-binding protein n=1 Tax=Streptomyces gobiensis TaxID=2875706 RepID=UPI001E2C0803|nr:ABC transporter substrate-binding protein [Streptomyces gobiensis]UGY92040.1 ABC transporter substrate-binding protein [Streptomyces gobiensis]
MTAWRRFRLCPTTTAFVASALCTSLLLSGCGALPGGSKADKGPITVMTWAPVKTKATNMPGMPALAQAYARWVNAKGGINGRELKVITCNEGNDSVRAAQCARRARDEGAVAVVGSYSQHGRIFMPSLESDGIPYIGGFGVTEEEFTSPLSYPVNGGKAALLAGSGRQLAETCEQISLVRPDTIAGDELPGLFNAGLAAGKHKPATDIRAPEDSASYGREAELALRGAGVGREQGDEQGDGVATLSGDAEGSCVTAALGGRTGTFLDSFWRVQKEGPPVSIASVLGSVQQSLINRTGGKKGPLEGAYVTGWYPASQEPVWDQLREVVREHAFTDNRIDTSDPGVQTTWVAYTVLTSVLESLGDRTITGRTIKRALDTGEAISTGGITPDLSWRYDSLLGTLSYPRIVNAMVNFQRVENGQLTTTRREAVDIAPTLEQVRSG